LRLWRLEEVTGVPKRRTRLTRSSAARDWFLNTRRTWYSHASCSALKVASSSCRKSRPSTSAPRAAPVGTALNCAGLLRAAVEIVVIIVPSTLPTPSPAVTPLPGGGEVRALPSLQEGWRAAPGWCTTPSLLQHYERIDRLHTLSRGQHHERIDV